MAERLRANGDVWIDTEKSEGDYGETAVAGYLFALRYAHQILADWDREYQRLCAGEWLTAWKQTANREKLSLGGRRSGAVRAKQSRLATVAIEAEFEQLMKLGHASHNVAAILAQKLGVTADHIRRIRRQSKKPT